MDITDVLANMAIPSPSQSVSRGRFVSHPAIASAPPAPAYAPAILEAHEANLGTCGVWELIGAKRKSVTISS
jgi:hypothetical protein